MSRILEQEHDEMFAGQGEQSEQLPGCDNCKGGYIEESSGPGMRQRRCPDCNPVVKTPIEEREETCSQCGGKGGTTEGSGPGIRSLKCDHCGGSGAV